MWTDVERQVVGLTKLSKSGCKFGWYFYRSRCNCSCLTFCTIYKYERDRTLGDRMDSDQSKGGNGPNLFCLFAFSHALEMFIHYEVVTQFRP